MAQRKGVIACITSIGQESMYGLFMRQGGGLSITLAITGMWAIQTSWRMRTWSSLIMSIWVIAIEANWKG